MNYKPAVLALAVAVTGCGGSSSSDTETVAPEINSSGSVTKGPVTGASVLVYRMDASGEASGEPVAGPFETGADGTWSGYIPPTLERPLLVTASGGSYQDEATGTTVTVGTRTLNSFLPEGADTSAISPVSEIVVEATRKYLADNAGSTVDDGIAAGKEALQDILAVSFDPLTTVPDPAGDDSASREYAAVLGGLSQMAEDLSPGTDPLDTVLAIVQDASDGVIDGESDGAPVVIGDSEESLPAETSVSALASGIATYTADPENGDFSDVTAYTLTASVSGGIGGSVSPEEVSVFAGNTASFTFTPETGYQLATTDDGCPGSLAGNTFTTTEINGACSLTGEFEPIPVTVTVRSATGGTPSQSSVSTVYGETVQVTFAEDEGYDLVSVSGCGGSLAGLTYTTGELTQSCNVVPVYELEQRTVEAVASPAGTGTFDPAGPITVDYGSEVAITIIPAPGYALSDAQSAGDGCAGVLSGDVYTFSSLEGLACQLSATFSPVTYTVSTSPTGPGTIAPGSVVSNYGEVESFTLTADTGAVLVDATGCNGSLSGTTYTTGGIVENCTVSATFEYEYTVTASAGANGSVSPVSQTVLDGGSVAITVTPDSGYLIDTVTGCGGSLNGSTYTTAAVNADCSVQATFIEDITPTPDAVWDQFNWDEANWQ